MSVFASAPAAQRRVVRGIGAGFHEALIAGPGCWPCDLPRRMASDVRTVSGLRQLGAQPLLHRHGFLAALALADGYPFREYAALQSVCDRGCRCWERITICLTGRHHSLREILGSRRTRAV